MYNERQGQVRNLGFVGANRSIISPCKCLSSSWNKLYPQADWSWGWREAQERPGLLGENWGKKGKGKVGEQNKEGVTLPSWAIWYY